MEIRHESEKENAGPWEMLEERNGMENGIFI